MDTPRKRKQSSLEVSFTERLDRFIRNRCPECGGEQVDFGKPEWPNCKSCDAKEQDRKKNL